LASQPRLPLLDGSPSEAQSALVDLIKHFAAKSRSWIRHLYTRHGIDQYAAALGLHREAARQSSRPVRELGSPVLDHLDAGIDAFHNWALFHFTAAAGGWSPHRRQAGIGCYSASPAPSGASRRDPVWQ
jgi:hypothetical protein